MALAPSFSTRSPVLRTKSPILQRSLRARLSSAPKISPPRSIAPIRHASATASSGKGRMLEKPSKYAPPSHPARFKKRETPQYGGELNESQKSKQRSTWYPNTMPPAGTWIHRFLTLPPWGHAAFLLTVLLGLGGFTWWTDFKMRSPDAFAALPSWRDLAAPARVIEKCYEAMQINMLNNTRVSEEVRNRRSEDAQRRRAYRLVHGLDAPDSSGVLVGEFGPATGAVDPVHGGPRESKAAWKAWFQTGRLEKEGAVARTALDREEGRAPGEEEPEAEPQAAQGQAAEAPDTGEAEMERPRRSKPKKWFGIWE